MSLANREIEFAMSSLQSVSDVPSPDPCTDPMLPVHTPLTI